MDKYYWILLAVSMIVVEVLSPTFGFILVAAAAALAAAVAAIDYSLVWQVLVFVSAVVLFIGLLRPRIIKKIYSSENVPSRTDLLIGEKGRVSETIDSGIMGRVTVLGQDWAAQSMQRIDVGDEVTVESAEGIVLKVSRTDR